MEAEAEVVAAAAREIARDTVDLAQKYAQGAAGVVVRVALLSKMDCYDRRAGFVEPTNHALELALDNFAVMVGIAAVAHAGVAKRADMNLVLIHGVVNTGMSFVMEKEAANIAVRTKRTPQVVRIAEHYVQFQHYS